jgi:hypothetical protein
MKVAMSLRENLHCILLATSLLVFFSKPIGGEGQRDEFG